MLKTICSIVTKVKAAKAARADELTIKYSVVGYNFLTKLVKEGFLFRISILDNYVEGKLDLIGNKGSDLKIRIYLLPDFGFTVIGLGATPGFKRKLSVWQLRKLKQRVPSAKLLLSTRYGLLTDQEALSRNVGGLLLCFLY